jgi:hypothetical protein
VFVVIVRTGSSILLCVLASSLLYSVNAFRLIVDCLIRATYFLASGCVITGHKVTVVVLLLVESTLIIVVSFAKVIERPVMSCVETESCISVFMLTVVSSGCLWI